MLAYKLTTRDVFCSFLLCYCQKSDALFLRHLAKEHFIMFCIEINDKVNGILNHVGSAAPAIRRIHKQYIHHPLQIGRNTVESLVNLLYDIHIK